MWFLERTPCGYRDPDTIRADLRAAGFASETIEFGHKDRACAECASAGDWILSGIADDGGDPCAGSHWP